jgi:hypothetical protein
VVVDDFNVIGSILLPYKANAKLIVDADTVLASPASSQWLQHISRWLPEIVKTCSRIHPVRFSPGYTLNAAPSPVRAHLNQFRGVAVFETPDHEKMIGCCAFNVKQSSLSWRTIARRRPQPRLESRPLLSGEAPFAFSIRTTGPSPEESPGRGGVCLYAAENLKVEGGSSAGIES